MNDRALIRLENVDFAWPGQTPIFTGMDLDLEPGAMYLVQGPSGSGKSTLLRLLCRLEEPVRGRLLFQGRPADAIAPPLFRRSVLYLQQTPTVIDGTVEHNLLLPFSFKANQDLPRPDSARLGELLERFLLGNIGLDENARNLSVGQLQRVCFIRALLLAPQALLLDEPTSALDEESALVVEQAAGQAAADGLAVVMVSHRPLAAGGPSPRRLALVGGRIEEKTWNRP